jgi:predicted RNA methylase
MDLKKRNELIQMCKEKGVKGYSGKKKEELLKLLQGCVSPPKQLKVVDLFAGTGAFSLAFREFGASVVFANDMSESSKKSYEENFDHTLTLKNLNDVRNDDIPRHDILTGGFPCQP